MSLIKREEFGIEKIIQELQEAVDLGDAPKRRPFGVFVRKEYLVEAIAKLRDYQALQSSDTSARLAAIKDIPTERVIAMAQAEAAGLVSISASAAEGADAQPNEPLTLEELREMTRKPVWVECKHFRGWAILHIAWPEIYVAAADGNTYFIWTNGEYNERLGAKLYRRPPEEV